MGKDPAPSLSPLGSAECDMAVTHARAVRGPGRARPGREGPCSLPLAARHSRQRHGRDTRTRRCAARAGRDPAGKGPALSLLAARHSRERHSRNTRTGGVRPEADGQPALPSPAPLRSPLTGRRLSPRPGFTPAPRLARARLTITLVYRCGDLDPPITPRGEPRSLGHRSHHDAEPAKPT